MTDKNKAMSFEVTQVDYKETRMNKVKVMVCQLNFDQMDFEEGSRLYFITNSSKNKEYIRGFLNIASAQQVDLVIFPELTIPSEYVNDLVRFSSTYDIYVIGGTHYKKTEKGYLSICPIITPSDLHFSEKITPAPFETSSFLEDADGAVPGQEVILLRGTRLGDFAVTICLDYTNRELKNSLDLESLDFLVVPAFNGKSSDFFHSMQSEVQDSENGIYILYSNTISKNLKGEGRSSLFAFMHDCYKTEFKDKKRTDLNPSNKIYEFSDDKSFCIFELDIEHKKPLLGKNWHTTSNVKVIMEDNNKMDNRFKFLHTIGASEDKYTFIERYYVKPREYKEMLDLLEKESILVITGDPGIGKTYTAIHFLWEYYNKGFKPTWFYGMDKGDRDSQKDSLMTFEPQKNDIVYIEDPFGRSVFENRDELKTLFGNLVQRFRACKAKLIITSRKEVFNQFEEESLGRDKLEDFMKELNVRKPSYGEKELKQIAMQYMQAYTNWTENKEIESMVIEGIENKKLISPMMIYNFVKNHAESEDLKLLKSDMEKAHVTDLVTQFADEIKSLSPPSKILLYLVLLYSGSRSIADYKKMFGKVQNELFDKMHFNETSFYFELNQQENYRIQRFGEQLPHYRFSHPAYEEALVALSMKDPACFMIAEKCVTTILKEDGKNAVHIFKRFVLIYPEFLEIIINSLTSQAFDRFSDEDKMELTRKMLLSNKEVFHKKAREIYPINKLIEGLLLDERISLLGYRIKSLYLRKNEIGKATIDWCRVFTLDRIRRMDPTLFLYCCEWGLSIDENLMSKIECNFQENEIVKKFLLLPTKERRERLNCVLSSTKYKNTYQILKENIPEQIMEGKKINRKSYAKYIIKYLLRNKPKGCVYLDEGAMRAIFHQSNNLYPIGVVDVTGDFVIGDVVSLVQRESNTSLLSLTEMSSDDIRKYKGLHSSEIYELEGQLVSTIISRPYRRESENYYFKKKKKRQQV